MSNQIKTDVAVVSADWKNYRNIAFGLAGILVSVWLAMQPPPEGLTVAAMRGAGVFLWALIYWTLNIIPEYVVSIIMCSMWVLVKAVPFSTAFGAYSGDTMWLLIGALGLGVALTKCGILKRFALFIMMYFPGNFMGQTMAMIVSGTLVQPLIPSVTAKAMILAPFAQTISDTLGYERKSRGAGGIFAAFFTGYVSLFPLFISASFLCYLMRGLMPTNFQGQFDWTYWFLAALPWGIVMLVLNYFAILLLYKPSTEEPRPQGFMRQKLKELGPMSRDEKIGAIVMAITILLLMTERIHQISSTIVILLALSLMAWLKILDQADFRNKMMWDAIIFFGGIICIASVVPALKIDKWFGHILGPYLIPLMSNMYVFVIAGSISVYLIRFIEVSQLTAIALFTVLLTPFAVEAGINPWAVGFVVLTSINVWNVNYQNTTFLAAQFATGGEMVTHKMMRKFSFAYMIISTLGLLACVPLWKYMGLIP